MKLDAHYYAVLGFSRACGMTKNAAWEVAYASQYVDDARINLIYPAVPVPDSIEYDTLNGRPVFFNMATCHHYTRMKTFNYSAMINNTCAFHFVPGCQSDLFPRKLRCSTKRPVIEDIMKIALDEDDPVRLGMVLHPYADSFSHRGFSGLLSKVNDIQDLEKEGRVAGGLYNALRTWGLWFFRKKFDRRLDALIPAYGHAQALDYPDLPYLVWSYKYDASASFSEEEGSSGRLVNPDRYIEAFKNIQKYLEEFLSRHPRHRDGEVTFKDFKRLFQVLVGRASDRKRRKNWRSVLVDAGLFLKNDHPLQYDRHLWLKEAFINFHKKGFDERVVKGAVLAPDFLNSHWYRYYRAVQWYKQQFFNVCGSHGLEIPH
jgi:hypothetical protein